MSWLASNRPELPRLEREGDYPPMAMSLTNTLVNQTGTWRIFRPVYQDRLPPCNAACPAGEPVQAYLDLVERGHFLEAYELIIQRNPFPSITGRVCFHPCEAACNRREFDEALGIHNVERFIGDHGQRRAPMPRPAVRRAEDVCIVGSGPAGLTAAYFLALRGYPVTVFEAAPKPGGLLRYGIPAYRLPPAVLDREIRRLRQL
ncbi:MAG: FAD-dependent oxidoreductase, partial [candidate division WOR-3 bacterium]